MPLFRKLLAATALVALAAPAVTPAQTVAPRRIVAFGDSYADDDNLFRILGRIPPPQPYPTGRFSGGTNFVDTLQQAFNAEQVNFAIGGAFTGPGNTGFDNINGPGIPGFQFSVNQFFAGGGGPFPTVTPSFGPDDLLAVSIGGNDARFYEKSGGTVAGAAPRAAISVGEAKAGLDRLVGAGARNIAFLAGNVGELPEVRGTPVAAVGSAFSNAFNAGIQTPLAGYAANGVLVHYLDLTTVGNQIRANPTAYGLVTADACPTSCVGNPELQKQYLFYVDQVHLTSAGFAIVARYFQSMIEAPGTLGAMSDIGTSSANAFANVMAGRNDLAGEGDAEHPLSFYLLATTGRHHDRSSSSSLGYDYDNTGVTGGVEYNPGGGGFGGVAVSYTRPRAAFDRTDARTRADAYNVGVYGGFEAGGLSISGTAGYGKLDYKMRRDGVIDKIRADTKGTTYSLAGEVSYGFDLGGGLTVGPLADLTYLHAKVNGYTETGDAALTLNVQGHRAHSLVGEAGIEAKAKLHAGGLDISPYIDATLAKELDSGGGTVRSAGTGSPTIVNHIRVGNEPNDVYGLIDAGASFALGQRVSAELQGRASIKQPGGNDYGGFVGVKVKF